MIKSMSKRNKKRMVIVTAILALMMILSACGGEKAMIKIADGGMTTEVETTIPGTVEKILKDAGIELGENDLVEPSMDTRLTEAQPITISREHKVKLTMDGETKELTLVGGTVQDLLNDQGIKLNENQSVNHDLNEYLTDNMDIQVVTKLAIKVTADGKTEDKSVDAGTVAEALKELGITVGDKDMVEPELTKAVAYGDEIVIKRVTTEEVTETEEIPFEVEYVYDSSSPAGTETTTQIGENGEKTAKYLITYIDGEEESRELIEESITKDPVNGVVSIGTYEAPAQSSSSSGSSDSSGGVYVVEQKAYPNCDDPNHGYYEIIYSDGTTEYVEY